MSDKRSESESELLRTRKHALVESCFLRHVRCAFTRPKPESNRSPTIYRAHNDHGGFLILHCEGIGSYASIEECGVVLQAGERVDVMLRHVLP